MGGAPTEPPRPEPTVLAREGICFSFKLYTHQRPLPLGAAGRAELSKVEQGPIPIFDQMYNL